MEVIFYKINTDSLLTKARIYIVKANSEKGEKIKGKVFPKEEATKIAKSMLHEFLTEHVKLPYWQCIKVKQLRKIRKDMDLEKWLNIDNNLYVGRRGRIFIDGNIFHYKESKWANPYKLSDYLLKESLELYEKYVLENLYDDLFELNGKNIGCFCEMDTSIEKSDYSLRGFETLTCFK